MKKNFFYHLLFLLVSTNLDSLMMTKNLSVMTPLSCTLEAGDPNTAHLHVLI